MGALSDPLSNYEDAYSGIGGALSPSSSPMQPDDVQSRKDIFSQATQRLLQARQQMQAPYQGHDLGREAFATGMMGSGATVGDIYGKAINSSTEAEQKQREAMQTYRQQQSGMDMQAQMAQILGGGGSIQDAATLAAVGGNDKASDNLYKQQAIEQGKYTITPDGLGGFIKINNKTGNTETINNPMSGGAVPGVDKDGNQLTGEDYLKTLDPRIGRTAKMVANGDMPWPSGFSLKSPYWQNVIAAAQTYDPTANGNRFPAVKQFNTGKQGDQVRAFDVGLSHLNTLSTLADALDNKDTRLLNTATNAWKMQTGQEAPADFNAAKEVVGNEIVKAIVGAGGGVGDREKAQKALDAANSPAQLKGVINTYTTLMKGQLGGLKQQYENSTGRKDFYSRLSPDSQAVVNPKEQISSSYNNIEDIGLAYKTGKITKEQALALKAKMGQ